MDETGATAEPHGEAFLREVLPTVARATSWRNQVFNSQNAATAAYSNMKRSSAAREQTIGPRA